MRCKGFWHFYETENNSFNHAFRVNNSIVCSFSQGNITYSGESASTGFIRTPYYFIPAGNRLTINVPEGYVNRNYLYRSTTGAPYSDNRYKKFTVPQDTYIRIKLNTDTDPLERIHPGDCPVTIQIESLEPEKYVEPDYDDRIEEYTNHHMKNINLEESYCKTYTVVENKASIRSIVPGSKLIKCDGTEYFNVVFYDTDDVTIGNAYVYIYVYDSELNLKTEYIYNNPTVDSNIMNRVFSGNSLYVKYGNQISNIPEGYYIQFGKGTGTVKVFQWDGSSFGNTNYTQNDTYDGSKLVKFPESGGCGLVVDANVRYLVAKSPYTFIHICALESSQVVNAETTRSTKHVPSQIIYTGRRPSPKLVTLVKNYNYSTGEYEKISEIIDITSYVCSVNYRKWSYESLQGLAEYRFRTVVRRLLNLKWIAKKNLIPAGGTAENAFKEGVQYNSIPYGSRWISANAVGWDVSTHTFVNAANDELSLFNDTSVSFNGSHSGGFYSLVCSSFATMVAGFPYPMTNFSLMHHPHVNVKCVDSPEVGYLYSNGSNDTNGAGHSVYLIKKGSTSTAQFYELVESVSPVIMFDSHYDGVTTAQVGGVVSGNLQYAYIQTYPYQCTFDTSLKQNLNIYNILDQTIVNGSARPHRGDKCVYTSNQDIKINIHDSNALYIILTKYTINDSNELNSGEEVTRISILGNQQVEIPKNLLESGYVYSVNTETDPTLEYFEYIDPEPINYRIQDGILICEDEFWYAAATSTSGSILAVGYEPSHDYTIYKDHCLIRETNHPTFFRKAHYGSYVWTEPSN